MTNIEAGHYDSRVEPGGAPELAAICAKLNHLAGALGEAVEDKRRLAERTELDLPYHEAVYRILFEGEDPRTILDVLV